MGYNRSKSNRQDNILFNSAKPSEMAKGDIFFSCQNSVTTLYDYDVIDDELRFKLQSMIIKKFGDLYPNLFPTKRQKVKP
jgi:hypothetical protein